MAASYELMPEEARPRRSPAGFRFSAFDAAVLALSGAATVLLWKCVPEVAWTVPFAAGHFFLFCNVFRVRRAYELAWAAALLVHAGAQVACGTLSGWMLLCVQTPLTLLAIAAEVRSPDYRGVRLTRPAAADE